MLLATLIDLYTLVLLGAVVISWVQVPPDHPAAQFVRTLTEPVLMPIRRALPPMGGLDFSPMVLLIALQLMRRMLMF